MFLIPQWYFENIIKFSTIYLCNITLYFAEQYMVSKRNQQSKAASRICFTIFLFDSCISENYYATHMNR